LTESEEFEKDATASFFIPKIRRGKSLFKRMRGIPLSGWSRSDFHCQSEGPPKPDVESSAHKKPRHPAGVSHMGCLGITPVVPHNPGA
jgi:hypothetical protein